MSPPPYKPPLSAHVGQMPRYCHHHRPRPNPEAESVSTCRLTPGPIPAQPQGAGVRGLSGPTAVPSPHYSTTRTTAEAHAEAQSHESALEPWWQRWTHTKLWELQKWARAETSLKGLVRQPPREMTENRQLQLAGGWMPQAAWKAMLADALHPKRVHPRRPPAPQDHLHVLGRLQETLQATQKDGKRL